MNRFKRSTNNIRNGAHVNADHDAHLSRVLQAFDAACRAKYEKGQAEHGGQLWQKPGLLDYAIEEAIDLVVYLFTLREQQQGHV